MRKFAYKVVRRNVAFRVERGLILILPKPRLNKSVDKLRKGPNMGGGTMAQFDVFVSHDTRDFQLASRVHNILDKVGMRPYIYEFYPQYRRSIPEAIRDVIKSCSVCLVLLTSDGIQSFWVHQELGIAFGYEKIIIPVVEAGIDFRVKGFVEFISHVNYNPTDFNRLAYDIVWALRNEVFGHDSRSGLRLRCPNGHESRNYPLPSTEEINKILEMPPQPSYTPGSVINVFSFECVKCEAQIRVSPWTFEEFP